MVQQATVIFHFDDGRTFQTTQINGDYNDLFALLHQGQRLHAPFEEVDTDGRALQKTVNDITSVEIKL